jgi:hypothetical protein
MTPDADEGPDFLHQLLICGIWILPSLRFDYRKFSTVPSMVQFKSFRKNCWIARNGGGLWLKNRLISGFFPF